MNKDLFENKKYTLIEESHFYTSEKKLELFGYGEWVEEADKIVFTYKDYDCMVHRVVCEEKVRSMRFMDGHLCGYVRIPQEHFSYGKDEFDEIDCHGGITFNDNNTVHKETSLPPAHWIGFDCAHSTDLVPSREMFNRDNPVVKQLRSLFEFMNPIYRNVAYCINECMLIVDKLIETQNIF